MKTQAVLFDLIGTTVLESGNVILDCFENAFGKLSIRFDRNVITNNRGKDKLEMIRLVLKTNGKPETLAAEVYKQFKKEFISNVVRFETRPGAEQIFQQLKERGIQLGIGTGMERELLNVVVEHLHWDKKTFDYIGIGPELKNQRPHPDMIFDMMKKTGIENPASFVKVGDTVADIQEGKNAGVRTVAILAGTQAEDLLLKAQPDWTIRSLAELQQFID